MFDDPHAGAGNMQEAEVTRVRTLRGAWRWALVVATAATILLCINQQFSLRFFIGYTQLNTEYFYLLIALMLPFTFLIFPGTGTSPLDRIPWYDILLFVATFACAILLMLSVRKAAEAGWEFGGAPTNVIVAGIIMWAVLMEALRRTGGWSLLLSVFPFTLYPLFADAKWLGPFRGTQSTLEQATAYHVLSGESLLGIPIQAFADTVIGFLVFGTALMMTGAGKFFINISFALCGTFRGGAAKVCIFASGLLGMMSGSIISNVLTAGTMTIPVMKKSGFRASYAAAIEACASTGAVLAPPVMGATAFVIAQFLNVSYAEVALAAIIPAALFYAGLFMQVDSYAARHGLKGIPRAELPKVMDTIKDGWYYIFVIALLIVMLLYFKRESHAPFYATALLLVLNQLFSKDTRWTFGDHQQVPRGQRPHLRRAGRHPRRLRPSDRRVLDDRRGLQPRQRSAADCRRQRVPAARHVRPHEPDPRARPDHDRLLHLPRHPGGARAGEGRPQPHGRAHVHLLLGHAVIDHPACRHRLLCRGRHRRLPGDENGMGIDVGRQHHLLHSVLLRAEPGAGAAGVEPVFRGTGTDGPGGFGTLFICGGIQGYQAFVGDLRGTGTLEWPLRVLLVIGGFVLATPGGNIMPLSQWQITSLGLAILIPTVLIALVLIRRQALVPNQLRTP